MKKKLDFNKYQYRFCDDRPVYEPEDNLYAGAEYEQEIHKLNGMKKLKTNRYIEKYQENHPFDAEN